MKFRQKITAGLVALGLMVVTSAAMAGTRTFNVCGTSYFPRTNVAVVPVDALGQVPQVDLLVWQTQTNDWVLNLYRVTHTTRITVANSNKGTNCIVQTTNGFAAGDICIYRSTSNDTYFRFLCGPVVTNAGTFTGLTPTNTVSLTTNCQVLVDIPVPKAGDYLYRCKAAGSFQGWGFLMPRNDSTLTVTNGPAGSTYTMGTPVGGGVVWTGQEGYPLMLELTATTSTATATYIDTNRIHAVNGRYVE